MSGYSFDDYWTGSGINSQRHERNGSIAGAVTPELHSFSQGDRTDVGEPGAVYISIFGEIDIVDDVDVYRIEVLQRDLDWITLTFDIDYAYASGLDSQIALFDASGNFIQDNDDMPAGVTDAGSTTNRDSAMTFVPTYAGYYYVAVTSYNNDWRGGTAGGGNSTGDYVLHVGISGAVGSQLVGTRGSSGGDEIYDHDGTGVSHAQSIYGYAGNDLVYAYDGNDTVYAGDGADQVHGGAGVDSIYGESHYQDSNGVYGGAPEGPGDEDALFGDAGNDVLIGGRGNDSLYGGADDDFLFGGHGDDRFDGGAGADTYQAEPNSALGRDNFVIRRLESTPGAYDSFKFGTNASSFNGAGVAGGDEISFAGFSGPVFWRGNTAFGTALGSPLTGGGNGVIDAMFADGAASETWLAVDADDDGKLGAADLLVRFEADLALVLADFKGEVYGESFGTAADETFTGTGKSQFIRAGDGADTVNGLGGVDLLYGEGGADSLSGGDAGDSLHGEADKDRLNGGAGRDHLFGGAAVDKLQGGDDADVLEGGQGADRLNGGAKADVFRFMSVGDRGDIIEDFTRADFIGVSAAGFGGGLVAGAALIAGVNFVAGASPNAPGAQGCFLYDTDDGRLFWDADGNGAGGRLLIATLSGAPALGAADFLVS